MNIIFRHCIKHTKYFICALIISMLIKVLNWSSGYYCRLIKSLTRSPITAIEIAPRTYHVKYIQVFRICSRVKPFVILPIIECPRNGPFIERTRSSVCLSNQRLTTARGAGDETLCFVNCHNPISRRD